MKVFITGGSGFLGINLIRALKRKGIKDIQVLDIAEFDCPEKNEIQFIKGDVRNSEALALVIKGADVVIHAAAALPLYSKEEIYTTDIEGTKNLLEAAHIHGVQRVIHISSTAVYAFPTIIPFTRMISWKEWAPTVRPRSRRRRHERNIARRAYVLPC